MFYDHLCRTYLPDKIKCPSIHAFRHVNKMLQNVTIKKSRVLLGNYPDVFGSYVAVRFVIYSLIDYLRVLKRWRWIASSLDFSKY